MATPAPDQEKAIADAARRFDEARRNCIGDRMDKTRTLTALYNNKATWPADAHHALDAVFAAYGWRAAPACPAVASERRLERPSEGGPADMTDAQIPEMLLSLNVSRSGAGVCPQELCEATWGTTAYRDSIHEASIGPALEMMAPAHNLWVTMDRGTDADVVCSRLG